MPMLRALYLILISACVSGELFELRPWYIRGVVDIWKTAEEG